MLQKFRFSSLKLSARFYRNILALISFSGLIISCGGGNSQDQSQQDSLKMSKEKLIKDSIAEADSIAKHQADSVAKAKEDSLKAAKQKASQTNTVVPVVVPPTQPVTLYGVKPVVTPVAPPDYPATEYGVVYPDYEENEPPILTKYGAPGTQA